MYSFGKSYEEVARRSVSMLGNERPNKAKRGTKSQQSNFQQKRLYPPWMCGVKRCFVFARKHLACRIHGREELSEATERLKAKYPTVLLTVENLAGIYEMNGTDNEVEHYEELEDYVQLVEGEATNMPFIASTYAREFEQHFAMAASSHERGLDNKREVSDITRGDKINSSKTAFTVSRFGICASRTSGISTGQYKAHRETLRLPIRTTFSGNQQIN